MRKIKILSLLLALTMILGLFSACGSGPSDAEVADAPAAETPAPQEEAPEVEPEAPVEEEETPEEPQLQKVELPLFEETRTYTLWTMLPFFMSGLVSDMGEDINTLRLLQEYCNAKIEVTSVSDSMVNEQFNILVAGGEFTDILYGVSSYANGYDAAISNDIIIDLYDLAVEYAPNYMYYLNSDPELWAYLITDNGYLPTISTLYKEKGIENGGIIVRGDWLRELGIDAPQTYEEFHDYTQTCISTYGAHGMSIGSPMENNKADDVLYSYGYDFNAGGYNVIDGKVVYSYLNDSYYPYLRMLADWYADGTIYADFFNSAMGRDDMWFASGECGSNSASAANIATIAAYADPAKPYEIYPVGALKHNADDELHFSWTDSRAPIKQRDTWAISTSCEDPEGIMMMVNYLFSEEGQLMFNYGDEGHTFEYDENGEPQYTELVTNNPDGISYMDACYIFVSAAASGHMPGILDVRAGYYYFSDADWLVYETFKDCDADGSNNLPNGVSLNEEETEAYSHVSPDVTTYASEEIMKFLMGQSELTEETFAAFQDNVRSMGGDQMEEIYQGAYERYLDKIGA